MAARQPSASFADRDASIPHGSMMPGRDAGTEASERDRSLVPAVRDRTEPVPDIAADEVKRQAPNGAWRAPGGTIPS